jgi:hypothetical protein
MPTSVMPGLSIPPSSIPGLNMLSADEEFAAMERIKKIDEENKVTEYEQAAATVATSVANPSSGAKLSSRNNISKLYEAAQKQRVDIKFDYTELLPGKFTGRVRVGNAEFVTPDRYGTKKDAKEAAAQIGFDYLSNPTAEAEIQQVTNRHSPIPINKASVSGAAAQLNTLCQRRGIEKKLEIEETANMAFRATLRLGDTNFRAEGPYISKREARDAVSQLGINYLDNTPPAAVKSEDMTISSTPERGASSTNYISQLHSLAQKHGIPTPDFSDTVEAHQQFIGVVTIGGQTFRELGSFHNKKAAKEAVAEKAFKFMEEFYQKDDIGEDEKAKAALYVQKLNGTYVLVRESLFQLSK